MKTLKESLFDKDLAEKDLKFRDAYTLLDGYHGMRAWGMPIGQMFSETKVSHYKNPYYPEVSHYKNPYYPGNGFFNSFNAGLLGIIADMPVPSKKDIIQGSVGDWCQKLTSTLRKYIRNSWKMEFDRKFVTELRPDGKKFISVTFNFDDGTGGYRYVFKINGIE